MRFIHKRKPGVPLWWTTTSKALYLGDLFCTVERLSRRFIDSFHDTVELSPQQIMLRKSIECLESFQIEIFCDSSELRGPQSVFIVVRENIGAAEISPSEKNYKKENKRNTRLTCETPKWFYRRYVPARSLKNKLPSFEALVFDAPMFRSIFARPETTEMRNNRIHHETISPCETRF